MSALEILSNGPVAWFRDWPNPAVPLVAAGVYTIWDGDKLIYAGMGGHALSLEGIRTARQAPAVKGLRQRLASHASGRRSGDQFCVYVADRLVLPTLDGREIAAIGAGERSLDARVRRHMIRTELRLIWGPRVPHDLPKTFAGLSTR